MKGWWALDREPKNYTVKLARAKLPANSGNFTCSLPVNTGKFTCFEAASTSRRTHANCLRAHLNLLEYHRHFTGSFTCGSVYLRPSQVFLHAPVLQCNASVNSFSQGETTNASVCFWTSTNVVALRLRFFLNTFWEFFVNYGSIVFQKMQKLLAQKNLW